MRMRPSSREDSVLASRRAWSSCVKSGSMISEAVFRRIVRRGMPAESRDQNDLRGDEHTQDA